MIEGVYSSEMRGNSDSALIKIPKNVRQIGQANEIKKIYIEDYVMSYIKQVGARKNATCDMLILLGQFAKLDDCQFIFISGAVEAENVIAEENLVITNETWNSIYENVKNYFTDVEIIGWVLIRAGLSLTIDEKIKKIHMDNFAGQDKTLILYDSLEREEAFYMFEDNRLRKQNGYYIYYDKNPEMQNYMITMKMEKQPKYEIRRNQFATVKKPPVAVKAKKIKLSPGLFYGAGVVASVMILVICVAILNGSNQKPASSKSQSALSENIVTGDPGDADVKGTVLPIETVQGTLSKVDDNETSPDVTKEDDSKASAENSETPSAEPSPSPSKNTSKSTEESSKTSSKDYKYYVVKKGDTLISICKKLNKTSDYISKIKTLNNIDDTNKIIAGQKILLP